MFLILDHFNLCFLKIFTNLKLFADADFYVTTESKYLLFMQREFDLRDAETRKTRTSNNNKNEKHGRASWQRVIRVHVIELHVFRVSGPGCNTAAFLTTAKQLHASPSLPHKWEKSEKHLESDSQDQTTNHGVTPLLVGPGGRSQPQRLLKAPVCPHRAAVAASNSLS